MCVSSSKQFAPMRMSGQPDSRRSRLRMGDPGNMFVEARSWHNAFLLLPRWFSKTRPWKLAKLYKQSSHRVRLTGRTAPVVAVKTVVRLDKDSCKRLPNHILPAPFLHYHRRCTISHHQEHGSYLSFLFLSCSSWPRLLTKPVFTARIKMGLGLVCPSRPHLFRKLRINPVPGQMVRIQITKMRNSL